MSDNSKNPSPTTSPNRIRITIATTLLLVATAIGTSPLVALDDVVVAEPPVAESTAADSKVPEKSIVCYYPKSCAGDFHELFLQIYVGHNGEFWLQPSSQLLDVMTDLGYENICVLKNDTWFQVMPEDGDGGETSLKNSIQIADLTNPRVRFYIFSVSSSDNTCRITGLHRYPAS